MRTKDLLKQQLEEAMAKLLPKLDEKIERVVDTYLHQHIGKILMTVLGIDTSWSDWKIDHRNGHSPFVSRLQSMAMQAAETWIADQMPQLMQDVINRKSTVRNYHGEDRPSQLRSAYAQAFDSAFDDAVRKVMDQRGKADGVEFAEKLIKDFLERELKT